MKRDDRLERIGLDQLRWTKDRIAYWLDRGFGPDSDAPDELRAAMDISGALLTGWEEGKDLEDVVHRVEEISDTLPDSVCVGLREVMKRV